MNSLSVVIMIIVLAIAFDFMNGLHDAANSIATVVSTRVLTPKQAVIWAAFFNFIAFLFFSQHVAKTMGTGIIDVGLVDTHVIFGALMGATLWNILTWWLALPSSSSHALIGGLMGAAAMKAHSLSAVVWSGVAKIGAAIILSPLFGYILAMVLMIVLAWGFKKVTPYVADRTSRKLQLISAGLYSLGHGGNDAQKVMGVITMLLYSEGYLKGEFAVPFYVVIACQSAMALGTLFGGWKIVKTMGSKITDLRPVQGCAAETGGAITLFAASWLGIPVSTTHTITGAIIGAGAITRGSAVQWHVASRIAWGWVITIPASAALAALFQWLSMFAWK